MKYEVTSLLLTLTFLFKKVNTNAQLYVSTQKAKFSLDILLYNYYYDITRRY